MTVSSGLTALRRRLTISVRLGLAFAAVFLVVLGALSILAYWAMGQMLRSGVDRTLVDAAGELATPNLDPRDTGERRIGGVEATEVEFQVLDRNGRILGASDRDLQYRPVLTAEQASRTGAGEVLFDDVNPGDEPLRVLATRSAGGDVLVVTAELDSVHEAQEVLLWVLLPLNAVAGLLAGLIGWFVARRSLAPVARMTREADTIRAQDLARRLPVPDQDDEVARLGRTLNEMLARIEAARARERDFTADASHELRTPLAILRAEIELARTHASRASLRASLDSAIEECDRLAQLVDDLLLLARVDAGRPPQRAPLDVADTVDTVIGRFGSLAERRGVRVTRRGDAAVVADGRALDRALSNLVDNAIRHAPDGGRVSVDIEPDIEFAAITVTDDGPGVPAQQRRQLTQRFTQLDPSRTSGGAGLGLAIVAAVAASHGGVVEIDGPAGGGLAVTMRLPTRAAAPSATASSDQG